MYNQTYNETAGGRTTVTTAGTRVQISGTSTPCRVIHIQALETNTGNICVGGVDVVAAAATRKGIVIVPGGSYDVPLNNLNIAYIDSAVNSEGVSWEYYR